MSELQAENARLRAALEEIAATNQIREFMGDDKSDGYGNEGWVVRDGQYAKMARSALDALSTPIPSERGNSIEYWQIRAITAERALAPPRSHNP